MSQQPLARTLAGLIGADRAAIRGRRQQEPGPFGIKVFGSNGPGFTPLVGLG